MRSKKFPNLSNAISNDDLRPAMNYAVVQDGRIIATDGHILVNINLKIWIDDADELENLEGKIFNLKLLKKISKIWDQLIFEKDRILFREKDGFTEFSYYSGRILKNDMMEKFNSTSGQYEEISKFINWKKFVPISTKSKLKTDESPEIQEASFNLDIVNDAVNSFTTKVVRFIATGGKNKPFIVTPCDYSSYKHEEFSEYAMIMPLMS